jgi:hypothetical protein
MVTIPTVVTSPGTCYEKGLGVAQDHIRAAQLYTVIADKGVPEGQFNLGKRNDADIPVLSATRERNSTED